MVWRVLPLTRRKMRIVSRYIPWVLIGLMSFFWMRECSGRKEDNKQKDQIITEKDAAIEEGKTRYGNLFFAKQAVEADYHTLVESYQEIKDANKELGIKNKNLKAYVRINTKTTIEGTAEIVHDTVYNEVTKEVKVGTGIKIRDRWLHFDGSCVNGLYSLTAFDSLQIVTARQKTGLFKPKETKVSVITHNPYTVVEGVRSVVVREPIRRWSVGPSFQYGISGSGSLNWNMGVSIQYSFIRF